MKKMGQMKWVNALWKNLIDTAYLFRSEHTFKNKIRIFATYVRIAIKRQTINRVVKLKHERIFGFTVHAFNYDTIKFLYQEIFYRNEYFFKTNKVAPVIFDCGANIGVATIYFKWLYPESTMHVFEPDKQTFELLQKNVLENKLTNVTLHNAALSDKHGEIKFYINSNNPGSLVMSANNSRMTSTEECIDVKAVTLSSVINGESIDFLKMDIEGSEHEVIREIESAGDLKNIKEGVIEYHHKISNKKSNAGSFLDVFERNGFEYQLDARCVPLSAKNKFQDVLIHFYK